MRNSFIPYGRQTVTDSDLKEVQKVLKSPYLTQGPTIEIFEKAISEKVSSQYSIAVNSATSALHISCLAIGLKEGDTLWTSPITFVASANCARYCGANVDFVDIDPNTGLISIKNLKEKLEIAKKENSLPKVVIPVHLSGVSCDMEPIAELADSYGFSIIEDASHAIGGTYKNKNVGGCEFSDISVFSFHPVKIITTGEGGVITTNNSKYAEKLFQLRSHGIIRDQKKFIYEPDGPWSYEQQDLGFNYRITDIQAALGISQLKRLKDILQERNRLLNRYKNLLKNLPIKFLEIPSNVYSSVHLAIIKLLNSSPDKHKEVFIKLREKGIGVQLHYSPVHLQPYYRKLGFKAGDFPNSENYAHSAISLPLFPGLTQSEQDRVIKSLKAVIQ